VAKAPPFFEIVTVGVLPVAPVMWSDDRTSVNVSGIREFDLPIGYPM
jgi:hypothetical protein